MLLGDEPAEQQEQHEEAVDDTYSPPDPSDTEASRQPAPVITPVQEYGTFVVRPTSETTDFMNAIPQETREEPRESEGVPATTSAHEID